MAATKVLARDYKFEIDTGTPAVPALVEIKGVTTWSPGASKNDADTTTFDDDGWQTHMVASRDKSLQLQGDLLIDTTAGDLDPGQEALRALSDTVGATSVKPFTITDPGGNTIVGPATCNFITGGGGVDAPATFTADIKFSGKPVFTAAP